ncbi:hypothetical protein FTX61_07910 [Nitriliruptoraceae bacterium ZYF776]|nr:hypothetical protein [Profundirhabdus halotolerans]
MPATLRTGGCAALHRRCRTVGRRYRPPGTSGRGLRGEAPGTATLAAPPDRRTDPARPPAAAV